MLRASLIAALLALTVAAQAETITAKVRHMCCGACKSAASAGLKDVAWASNVAIDADVVTVTVKDGEKADLVGLMDKLSKSGFPAIEITTDKPVTLTLAHLCCAGCANDLKAKVAEIRSDVLDKDKVVVDAGAKTVTLQPIAGKQLNIATLIRTIEARTGFTPSKAIVAK
jgi:copper chaperone CopZ